MLIAACLTARGGWRHGSPLVVRVPPGDDAAVLGDGTAITTDALVEGVHFDDRCAPADVGYKAVAVSVSDLAAMGARPTWATLNLSVPHHRLGWARALSDGLGEALQRWNIALIGGDTTGSPGPAMLSLTLGGTCVGAPLTRAGARPGDDLWVTGALGLAGAGWQLPHPPAEALAAWLRPDPPLDFALALAAAGLATAAMDLSDGLGQDLPKLAAASGLGARVRSAALPASDCLGSAPLHLQLFGGEDYQLLFAAPPAHRVALHTLAATHGVRLSCVGALHPGAGCTLDDTPWPVGGFTHFSERAA
jgi:thiamine-monophosphate kinase